VREHNGERVLTVLPSTSKLRTMRKCKNSDSCGPKVASDTLFTSLGCCELPPLLALAAYVIPPDPCLEDEAWLRRLSRGGCLGEVCWVGWRMTGACACRMLYCFTWFVYWLIMIVWLGCRCVPSIWIRVFQVFLGTSSCVLFRDETSFWIF